MNKNEIIQAVRKDLARYNKPEFKIDAQRFFKEELKRRFVLKTSIIRIISNTHFKEVKELPKKEIFEICEEFLGSGRDGEKSLGFIWAGRCHYLYTKSDFELFESWLKKHVDSWANCDALCCFALGILLFQYPDLIRKTVKWRKSKNRWLRRASAVALIYSLGREKQLKTAFEAADMLLSDEDDMVQKGYGWMLKVASKHYPDHVFRYVLRNRETMPRTALRYAIEKYPKDKRKEAMKKD
ncbi:MAG: DNA alkylation repair protein [Candidatus Zixiibacteriota bacterium]|nr:MAG: DNA alkylation repair protein [candidate division Zixibacteria bacterium]HHI03596.1 DNA alkylation repair protein [candidate division Zixibacteria bacterium]